MIYVISKATFGSYNVRDIQSNANWCSCPYSDYALIPDDLVEGILATQGYCDIVLDAAGTTVTSFTARAIPSVPEECHGTNTVLSVNGVTADDAGLVELVPADIGAQEKHRALTIMLPADGWANDSQTVAVSGVTVENTVIVTPHPASYLVYCDGGVYCSAQENGSLTFERTSYVGETLGVNVLILD